MADWPGSLPTLRLPASLGLSSGVARTPTDVGHASTRRRTTADPEQFSHVVRWTPAQLGTFLTFWNDTIGTGALPFNLAMPAPISATRSLRFLSSPVFQKTGRHYVATFELELMPE